ncbi:photoreceptor outer segment membrane glycoprotein 2-like [Lineus longissimus]|uniref:photoreceptor outer segment membrane glycoprotein 2-like n=1 Tax=Lineus longissimus TaxID=88925 RepID=UPI00315CAE1C
MPGPCLELNISEKGRLNLMTAITVLNGIAVLLACAMMGCGAYIKLSIEEKLNLIGDYNNDILPWVLVAIGLLSFLVAVFGIACSNWCQDLKQRTKVKGMLLPYIAVAIFLSVCVFASSLLTFAQIAHIHSSFGIGIGEAMRKYKYEDELKQQVDGLQMGYSCCGMKSYDDWFKVSWIHDKYLSNSSEIIRSKMVQGEYYNDDAPFSCCNPSSDRPCIHHHVHHNDAHYNYDFKVKGSLTLFMKGCQEALSDYFRTLLVNCGAIFIGIFCVQILLIICMRFLQTSITQAFEFGEASGDAPGWLFGSFGKWPPEEDTGEEKKLLNAGPSDSDDDMFIRPSSRRSRGSVFDDWGDEKSYTEANVQRRHSVVKGKGPAGPVAAPPAPPGPPAAPAPPPPPPPGPPVPAPPPPPPL